jgi:hypothetical protein
MDSLPNVACKYGKTKTAYKPALHCMQGALQHSAFNEGVWIDA